MIAPRWRKVYSDLVNNRRRTALAAVALAIGSFAVGVVLSAWAVLTREIDANFLATQPPSIVVHVGGAGATAQLAREVEALDGVARAEARGMQEGRIEVAPDEWRRALLYTVDDFDHLRVSTFTRDSGRLPAAPNEVLLERSAVRFLERGQSSQLTVRSAHGERTTLSVVGIAHDAAQSPGWMDGIAYLYRTRDTLQKLGEGRALNELHVIPRAGADRAPLGEQIRSVIEESGGAVDWVNVRPAPRHPHADQMQSLLFLFGAFGALSLLLGGVLAAHVISALLAQQVQQIGMMKAVGATARQVASMYLAAVGALAALALLIALPLGAAGGLGYAKFVAGILNFELTSRAIPLWVFAVQALASLGVPLLAAAVPVRRAVAVSAWTALADVGLRPGVAPGSVRAPGWAWLSRPTLLALGNLLRARGRMWLTAGLLAVGGATFMAALDVSDAWQRAIDELFESRKFDLQVVVAQPMAAEQLQQLVAAVPGVGAAEPWRTRWAFISAAGGPEPYRVMLTGVPPTTTMIDYPLLAGRWLRPDDTNAVVINHELAQDPAANLHLGDTFSAVLDGQPSTWHVVGVVKELGVRRRGQNVPASAYVNQRALGGDERVTTLVVSATTREPSALHAMSVGIERALDRAGVTPTLVQSRTFRRQELLDHLVVIRDFLLAMALLVGTIGGLALTSALSVAVLERTREIGVLRAIGASRRAILSMFVTESVVVALLGWMLAVALSVPLTLVLGRFSGNIFVHAPLPLVVSTGGVLAWLAISVGMSALASLWPANAATRGTVGASLHYA